jgi:cobyrinic acid a,c-diamide synthase
MPSLLISAAHKSSGKTTISVGLCAALTALGKVVQPFKKGPDYIDPMWLTEASQRPCHNLDFYTMSHSEIRANFARCSGNADISIIEGNKGLYDGMDIDGSNSNAALAELLQVPIVLVIDAQGMTRGIAPLILGYQQFAKRIDKNIEIAGIILNRVGGSRHESKLRQSVEYYTDVPIVGAVQRDSSLEINERHLGLMPSNEDSLAANKIQTIAERIAGQVNLEQLLHVANHASLPRCWFSGSRHTPGKPLVTIGIVRDAAFGFYYAGDLDALQNAGARLVFIDALRDSQLPSVDALIIGGGFPETQMEQLSNNTHLKHAIRTAVEQAMPVYAECGGLMYLSRRLTWGDKTCDMVGALPFDTVMQTHPQGRGYVHLRETGMGLWPLLNSDRQPGEFYAHEFHYSKAINLPSNLTYAYQVLRGYGIDGHHDGVVYKNTLVSYAHLRDVEKNHWTQRFVEFVCTHRNSSETCHRQ